MSETMCDSEPQYWDQDSLLARWQDSLKIRRKKPSGKIKVGARLVFSGQDYSFLFPQAGLVEPGVELPPIQSRGEIVGRAMSLACVLYDMRRVELTGETRAKDIVSGRRCLIVALKKAGFSYTQIGRYLNRDHSTIMYNIRQFATKATDTDRTNVSHILRVLDSGAAKNPLGKRCIVKANMVVARNMAARARFINTVLTIKEFRVHLECVLCSVLAYYNFDYSEIANVRGCNIEQAFGRVDYIRNRCNHSEIIDFKKQLTAKISELRGGL